MIPIDTSAETKNCQIVLAKINDKESIAIVDTPGFDDSHHKSDTEILAEVTDLLVLQHECGINLKGIIYFHRIIDPKMPRSAQRYLNMFQLLCGDEAMTNVIVATTMWSKLANKTEGYVRQQELRDKMWRRMETLGSFVGAYDGTAEMAEQMIMDLASKQHVVLQIQREICIQGWLLDETAAGKSIAAELEQSVRDTRDQLSILDERIAQAYSAEANSRFNRERQIIEQRVEHQSIGRKRLKKNTWAEVSAKIEKTRKLDFKDGLAIFAVIIGTTVNIVLHFLPIG